MTEVNLSKIGYNNMRTIYIAKNVVLYGRMNYLMIQIFCKDGKVKYK